MFNFHNLRRIPNLFFCLTLFFITNSSEAQITLEYTYPNASGRLYMVNLEQSGIKYVVIHREDTLDRNLTLYNLDHSLWKVIDCNSFPMLTYCGPIPGHNPFFTALYISQNLFDTDSAIEFMYYTSTDCRAFTGIYKEDGSAVLEVDSAGPLVQVMIPQSWRPIYSTPNGTKMILSVSNGSARVYSLPGELLSTTDQLLPESSDASLFVYPNPSYYQTQINFTLPKRINEADIFITDLYGHLIRHYKVDRTFSNLLINQQDVLAGTYIYSLTYEGKVLDSQKIILAK